MLNSDCGPRFPASAIIPASAISLQLGCVNRAIRIVLAEAERLPLIHT